MIYLSNEPYPQEISVPRSFGVIVPQRNTYLSTADIAADLTTDSDTKVLAASQGVVLKGMVDAKADADDVYTKAETDTRLATKANAANVYSKSQVYTKTEVDTALAGKADVADLADYAKSADVASTYETKSDAAASKLELQGDIAAKQDALVSGTNIKTINNESLLGSGNIDIQGGGGGAAWGSITGTLSDQTDLANALDAKADKSDTYTKAQVDSALGGKQDTISDLSAIRSGAAAGATAVQPSGLEAGLATKQDTLESGVNIKTINNQSLLGSGNIDIQGGGGTIDNEVTKDSANAVKSSGIYAALGKYGVISQTQTWTGGSSTGYTYTMSNLVWGLIPQAFIDEVTAFVYDTAGITFNETTGYFELNGLTDISYDEMRVIWATRQRNGYDYAQPVILPRACRTNFTLCSAGNGNGGDGISMSSPMLSQCNIEYFRFSIVGGYGSTETPGRYKFTPYGNLFYRCNYLRIISDNLEITRAQAGLFTECYSLEWVAFRGLAYNVDLHWSPNLRTDCLAYTINNAGTSAITITLHATAYARAIADADVQAALAAHTNVTLASA